MSRNYIETGVEWINSIPSNWKLLKVKNCFYISKEKAQAKNPTVLKLARDAVKVRDISTNEGQIAASYDDYNPVFPGDFLLNPMDLYSGANCNVSEVEGVISPAYINLRKTRELNPKYFDYYFKVQYWTMAMFAHGKGVSFDNRWTLNAEGMKNYEIPFPNIDEQNKIVAVINNKCSQIDELIAIQEQEIEKLKAYKQSLITEVVTKGLDPNAEMKDSDISWLSQVPVSWNSIRIKYLLKERKERSNTGKEEPLSMSQKYGLVPTKNLEAIPNIASTYIGSKLTHVNDLVFNKLKAHLGVFSVSKYDGLVSPDYAVYYSTGLVNLKYLEYLFKTPQCISEFKRNSTGIAPGLMRLYTDKLFSIKCPFPSQNEQIEIVNFLDKKCFQVDSLIDDKENKISKLNEYKKSLIYEYVTGKKEVM